jgi:hypothetical protein
MDVKVNKMITTPSKNTEELAWEAIADLTAQFEALLTKLDADSGDTGGDSDYASTLALTDRVVA